MQSKRYNASIISGLVVLTAAIFVWKFVGTSSTNTIKEQLSQAAFLAARSVESEINRFRYLPAIAGEDSRIRDLLRDAEDTKKILEAKKYLEIVAQESGASFLYVLDKNGLTLAASNWQTSEDLTGNNYSFRPYFQDAVSNGQGRFYAIGVTTGKPGYFLSKRINVDEENYGVVVVKVDLLPLEESWRAANAQVSVADKDNIIFLSGNESWKYRPFVKLQADVIRSIFHARTYEGINLEALSPIVSIDTKDNTISKDNFVQVSNGVLAAVQSLPDENWSLYVNADITPASKAALVWSVLTVLSGLLLSGALQFYLQRQQLIALRLDQNKILEKKVDERTRDLAHEIEERKNAEKELRVAQDGLVHAEKMAALGRMSAAIAHEVSQPLAALETTLASTKLIAIKSSASSVVERINTARNLVRRMQRTVKHLRTFSRKDRPERHLVNCVECMNDALELAKPKLKTGSIRPSLNAPAPVFVMGTSIRMEQVFLNLILNSIDALEMTKNPELFISVLEDTETAKIEITDNGEGIDADDLAHIKDPFFTTKTSLQGLGLGLSISQTIIEDHGGKLEIQPVPSGGTRATVSLPLIEKNRQAAE